jgi:hypothetical protein
MNIKKEFKERLSKVIMEKKRMSDITSQSVLLNI